MQIDKSWYQSKKVWVTLATFLVILLKALFPHWGLLDGLDEIKIAEWVGVAAAFLLAQGHVDASTRSASLIGDALKAAAEVQSKDPK